jgi:hypothetical protein
VPLVELHPGLTQPVAEAGRRIGLMRDDDEQTGHMSRLVCRVICACPGMSGPVADGSEGAPA